MGKNMDKVYILQVMEELLSMLVNGKTINFMEMEPIGQIQQMTNNIMLVNFIKGRNQAMENIILT